MNDDHVYDSDIGCMEAINSLYAYLDGELGDDVSIEQVETHLQHCRSCYTRAEIERALNEHLRRGAKRAAPAGARDRLRRLIDDL
ncbi:MAG: zf-HC2 domain-containing protein [Gammaproteobacteria bacterium]|nr:zf-HC2 domain-containing protein [Gammaproteobacteria bacterium]MDH4255522.1 zf-HC2 domain-containing protein [Gammaproteobacteria bacterium]MDH5311288.1 zf-HC2 domain-containing protein [Gammaproteobacteria bacterium]